MAENIVIKFYLYMVESPKNVQMVAELKRVLDGKYKDGYTLEVIDILNNPDLAEKNNIMATPTLVKSEPLPSKRLVGDFSNGEKIIDLLDRK